MASGTTRLAEAGSEGPVFEEELERARGRSLDECVVQAFIGRAEHELPFDPKDRLETPEPDYSTSATG